MLKQQGRMALVPWEAALGGAEGRAQLAAVAEGVFLANQKTKTLRACLLLPTTSQPRSFQI